MKKSIFLHLLLTTCILLLSTQGASARFNPGNSAPVFVLNSPQTLTVCENDPAVTIVPLLHITDADDEQTETWSLFSSASHAGIVAFTGATAPSGMGADVTPGGTITYRPATGFYGSESFSVTVSDGNGGTAVMTINVTVNQAPDVALISNQAVCTGFSTSAIAITGTVSGTSFTWANDNTSVGLAASGNGDIPSFTVTNSDTAVATATITVTPATASCTGDARIFTIKANPIPAVVLGAASVCSGDTLANVSFSGIALTSTTGGSALTFSYSGGDQSYTVPPGVHKLSVDMSGASGGYPYANSGVNPRARGGRVQSDLAVTPGQTLYLYVGQAGQDWTGSILHAGGFNGGGGGGSYAASGGGASDIRTSASGTAYTNRLLVAGGGGGGGDYNQAGGAGGGLTGGAAASGACGGDQTAPACTTGYSLGAFGIGATPGIYSVGGGGGGWWGGNSGVNGNGGGGGGSSYTDPLLATSVIHTQGYNEGNGYVMITPGPASAAYAITWDAAALTAGFTNVSGVEISSSSLHIAVPATAAPATYTGTLVVDNGTCTGVATPISITVNPLPDVAQVADMSVCNNSATASVSLNGAVGFATYTWSNSNSGIGLATSGTGDIASFTAINSGTAISTATITATAAKDGCTGAPMTFMINVKPSPTATAVPDQTICNGASTTLVSFTSSLTGTSYTWTNSNSGIGLATSGTGDIASFTAVNSGTVAATATITVTPSTDGCDGPAVSFMINVNPTPGVAAVADQAVCNASSTVAVPFSGAVSGTTYAWTNTNSTIGLPASGNGDIAAFTATNTTAVAATATITVTPSANSCVGTATSFMFTVNPTPTVNAIPNQSVCAGSGTSAVTLGGTVSGTTFSWTNNNTNIGLAAGGTGDIAAFTVANSDTAASVATITVTPATSTCTGNASTFKIVANPLPVFVPGTASVVCQGDTSATLPFTGISISAPAGSSDPVTFSYTGAAQPYTVGAGVSSISVDMGGASGGYAYIGSGTNPRAKGGRVMCELAVTPGQTLYMYVGQAGQDWTSTILSAGGFNGGGGGGSYAASGGGASDIRTSASGAAYTNRLIVAGGAGGGGDYNEAGGNGGGLTGGTAATGACGGGQTGPACTTGYAQGAFGIGATPGVYSVGGGGGGWWGGNAGVNGNGGGGGGSSYADPVLATSVVHTQGYNDGNGYIVITPAAAIHTYSIVWDAAAITAGFANVTNAQISATSLHISVPATAAAATYNGTVVVNDGTCSSAGTSISVTVNPVPTVNVLADQAVCNNTASVAVPFTGAVTPATYTWTNSNSGIGLATSGTGDIASFTAVNATTAPVTASVTVTPATATCTGLPISFVFTVNPTPLFTSTLAPADICNTTTFSYTPASAVTGTTYSWSRASIADISNAAATGTNDPSEVLTNTSANPVAVTYVYTLSANSCDNVQNVTVNVNPTPMLSSTLTPAAICNNTTFTYTPSSATTGTSYRWSRAAVAGISNPANADNTDPAEVLNNTTANPVTVTYVYTLTANSCTNTQNVDVVVNPTPVFTSTLTAAPVCNNTTFSYTPASATAGTAYAWSRAAVAGIANPTATGNGNPIEILNNTSADPVVVTYVYTLTANSCSNVQSVTVTVQPTPVFTSTLTPAAVCNNTTFNYTPASVTTGTAYAWSRAAVAGIANTAATGANNPAEVLNNTTANPLTVAYVYTLTANSCSNVETVTVAVNPTPVFTSTHTAAPVCNNTAFSYTPASATLGTAYTWSRAAVAGIANIANTGTNDPAETLNNTTPDPVTITYVYTLTANGCTNTQNVTVVVNPTPMLTSTLTAAPVCDSSLFSYVPTSATAGTAFTWSRAAVAGISNAAASGSNNPAEYLVNTTAAPIMVTYIDTLTANGCINTQPVTVIVNPKPLLTTTLTPAAICNNTTFNYAPASATTGTAYTWSRASVGGITNAAATGIDNPAETLVNTFVSPVTVAYVYTLTANGCTNSQVVSVVVNPTPTFTSALTPPAVCSSTPFSYIAVSATTGTTYSWTRPVVTGISNAVGNSLGASGVIHETLVNTTLHPVNVVYHYTLMANGCTNAQNVTVKVNPAPQAPVIATMPVADLCSNVMYQNFGAANPPTDSVVYTWTASGAFVYNQGQHHTNALVNFPVAGAADVILTANIYGIACYTADTAHVTVNSSVAGNPSVYYIHDHFVCTDNTVDSYQWGYDNAATLDSTVLTGEVDQNFHNISPDFTLYNYWVMTSKGGCMAKSYYNAPTGVTQVGVAEVASLSVFPNPASYFVAVEITGITGGKTTVELTDVTGRHISSVEVLNNKTSVNVDNLSSGVYMLSCYHNGVKVGTTKLVKD